MPINSSLRKIFSEIPAPFYKADVPAVNITGISIDSRVIQPGYLFVAMQGGTADGHQYGQKAIEKGAVAIVREKGLDALRVPYIQLENSPHAPTWIAAACHDWPAPRLTVVGLTGTDGKA